jgi:hypothetical protein
MLLSATLLADVKNGGEVFVSGGEIGKKQSFQGG